MQVRAGLRRQAATDERQPCGRNARLGDVLVRGECEGSKVGVVVLDVADPTLALDLDFDARDAPVLDPLTR